MQEGIVSLRNLATGMMLLGALALAGCASALDAVPPISDTASFVDSSEQVLQAGDSVRVVVFGKDALSGTYALRADGTLKLAALGSIPARGLTAAELEQRIAALLAEKGMADAQVSVMID